MNLGEYYAKTSRDVGMVLSSSITARKKQPVEKV